MSFWSVGEMAGFQALSESAMADTCQILRATPTYDDEGAPIPGTPAVIATVACRLIPAADAREQVVAQEMTPISRWVIHLSKTGLASAAVIVKARDQIASGGKTFEVEEALTPKTYEPDIRVACVRVGQS